MQGIYSYFDYQQFLRDFYNEKKRETGFFSYRYLGGKLGLDPGFLVKVLQGKMHLAIKSLPALSAYFKFDLKEKEYFETLVRYGRAASGGSEIKFYFEKLLSLKTVDANIVTADQYQYYQKWYFSAIREAIGFLDFQGDFSSLGALLSPSISAKEAKNAVTLLERLDLIHKDGEGIFRQSDRFITTGEKWQSAAIYSFQKETIRLAGESLDRHHKDIRDISTLTVAVSYKDFETIREQIRTLRHSILQMTNGNKADCVYQINIQAIPLTVIEKK
jgi:uncharacterized protein (TIGR02147 family)